MVCPSGDTAGPPAHVRPSSSRVAISVYGELASVAVTASESTRGSYLESGGLPLFLENAGLQLAHAAEPALRVVGLEDHVIVDLGVGEDEELLIDDRRRHDVGDLLGFEDLPGDAHDVRPAAEARCGV